MRKSAITAVLCLSFLTGCGRIEPVVDRSDSAETTVAVENKTEATTEKNAENTKAVTTSAEPDVTTASTNTDKKGTTTTASVIVHGGGTTLTVPKRTTSAAANTTTKRAGTTSAQTSTTASAVTTTTSAAENHKVFTKDDLECKVTKDGIDVSLDNKKLQTIDVDTEELIKALSDVKTEMKAQIIINDIDLDGHDDLFIPQQVGMLNTFGVYYHYDAEKEEFVKWEELKEIDSCAEVNKDDKTFTTELKLSEDEYEVKVFAWVNGVPVIQTMKKQYKSADNKDELLIDYFDYKSGEKQLVKRERVLFDAEGREVGSEEIELG